MAAYKAIELARMLMRHGADVTCVASGAAMKLIRPDYLKWATGNNVITKLTGGLEHIRLADRGGSDMIIVYPATANTLGKLANGIDDTPVSTVLTVALGAGIPIMICLAMHESMYDNAAVRRNIGFLGGKVEFVEPLITEGKAKAPEPADVLGRVLDRFGRSSALAGARVIIAAGPTIEKIDPVRVITSGSTGRTGVLLAAGMVSAGARVTLVYGPGREQPPAGARHVPVTTHAEMADAVYREVKKGAEIVVMAASVSDYTVRKPSKKKIKSGKGEITLKLSGTPKIIDRIKGIRPGVFLVGFKAEADVSDGELEAAAARKMRESGSDMMIANDVGAAYLRDPDRNRVLVLSQGGKRWSRRTGKERIAAMIIREIGKAYTKRDGRQALPGPAPDQT
ncbi:phosphopantothenoylcysteine synthetase/decarboxylase [Cenarchaeum symbiosum A]|uniref:Coenzyme A biosynthesis bifunctional protein CoaBC n=1 Tax=Cenarchaeum symbiosum (strain A) TaxID=414004 RepID=A0RXQ4_CENSY|nr:phosphopantothenoylcysteine synthetase/decarboxylase [Cenarchaeum symbiosum A]